MTAFANYIEKFEPPEHFQTKNISSTRLQGLYVKCKEMCGRIGEKKPEFV